MSTMSEAIAHSKKKGWLSEQNSNYKQTSSDSHSLRPIFVPNTPAVSTMEYLEMDARRNPPSQTAMDEFIPGVIRRTMTPDWMKRAPTPNPLPAVITLPTHACFIVDNDTTVAVAPVEDSDDEPILLHGQVDLEAQKTLPPRLEDAAFLPAESRNAVPAPASPKSWLHWLFRS